MEEFILINVKNTDETIGVLPCNAPLAMAYVPMQRSVKPAYEADEALKRGTLFPGLDLPFMGKVNKELEYCPLTELMSIDFVIDELELYLDTHADDMEAFMLYQTFLALRKEAKERYTALFGPVQQTDQLGSENYSWLADPWPWDYKGRTEG